MSEIEDRFTVLANDVPKNVKFHADEPEIKSDASRVADELRTWAASSDCSRVFLPWLRARIAAAEAQQRIAVRSHPDLAYYMGRRDDAAEILAQFHEWADKAQAPADEGE